MHFRNRFSLVLVSLAIISAMSFAAAGSSATTFTFVDSVKEFFGVVLTQTRSLAAKPSEDISSSLVQPLSPMATTYYWNGSAVTPTSGSDANITTVAFSSAQGNNNGTTPLISTTSASSGYAGASGTSNFGAACKVGALSTSTSTYFSVTLTPAATYGINLTSISLGSRGTGTGPTKITIYSDIDSYATVIGSATVLANSAWALSPITFSGGSLSGAVGTPVTLRIYGSDGTGAPSVNTANWRIDDINLVVTATSAGGTPSKLAITNISPASPTAGSGFNVTVQSQDSGSLAANVSADTAFTLSNTGGGLIGGSTIGTITSGSNSVTLTGVTLSSAFTGATLTATRTSGDTLTAGISAPFNVLDAANQIAFVGVPATGAVNGPLTTFTVEARRTDNSVDTTYTGNIVISKATGTGNLTGTLTKAAVAGVATFNDLQFDAAGTFTLNADSGSFTQIASGNIVVTDSTLTTDYFQSVSSGNWGNIATWESSHDAITWTPATLVPTAAANQVFIRNTHIVTVASSISADQILVVAGGQLTIPTSVTLTLANGDAFDLDVAGTVLNQGTITIGSGATMGVSGTFIHNTGTGSSTMLNSTTLAAGSTFIYRGSDLLNVTPSVSGRTFGNLVFESTGGQYTPASSSGGGALAVNGALTISSSGGGTVAYNTTGYTGTITVVGDVSIGVSSGLTLGNSTLKVRGNWNNGGSFTPGTSTVEFEGTAAQTITTGGSGTGKTFNVFKVNKGTETATLAGPLRAGTFNLTAGTFDTSAASSYAVTATGDLTILGGTFTANGSTISVGGGWFPGSLGTFTAGTSTVVLNGTGPQSLTSDTTFYNLSITSSTARTVTFEPSMTQTVTNSLTFSGAAGNLLSLRSIDDVNEWFLIAPVTRTASFVDVQLSNASGGQTMTATNSVNSGNNTNWTFVVPNQAPVAVDDVRLTYMNTALVTSRASLVSNDVDPDGPPLTVTSVSGGLNGIAILSGSNVTFIPDNGFTGTAGFDYTVSDGEFSDSGHVTVTVNPDATAPETVIESTPLDPSSSSSATFTFSGSDAESGVAGFECDLDSGGYAPCTSPKTYSGLANGSHTFMVRATDVTGNVDGSPATFTWNVAVPPPTVQFSTISSYYGVEGGVATVTVTRSGDTSGTSTVNYVAAFGTGTSGTCGVAGVDYVSASGTLTFNPTQTSKTFTVTLCSDAIVESPAETIGLALSSPTGAALGTPNDGAITIIDVVDPYVDLTEFDTPSGSTATVYPATINVSGYSGTIGGLTVSLYGVTQPFPDDIDILLVSPDGSRKIVLMSNAGGPTPTDNITMTFDDTATAFIPDEGAIIGGSNYKPTNCLASVPDFTAPAPAGPYSLPGCSGVPTATMASVFGGIDPNGEWKLYVRDHSTPFAPISPSDHHGGGHHYGWGVHFVPFVPTAAEVSLGGRVTTSEGRGIKNAVIVLTGNSLLQPMRVVTGPFGYYQFEGLEAGEVYVVTVSAKQFTFTAPSRVVTVPDNVSDADFIAMPQE